MKRALLIIGLLGLAALVMAARPASELELLTRLNGQPVHWVLPDAGQSGLGASSGLACITLDGGTLNGNPFKPNVLMFLPETPTNICIRPQVDPNGVRLPWDGGCNMAAGDINQGVSVQPYVPYYVVPHPNANVICGVSDAGMVRVPVYQMQ